jgi:ankyrin repeat protein
MDFIDAARNGYLSIVQSYVSRNINVNILNDFGYTALMYASLNDHYDVVEYLLKYGADVNIINSRSYNAIIYATLSGNISTVKLLVKHKANINVSDFNGWNPLMHAARLDNVDMIELFIRSKAILNHKDATKRTALIIARDNRNELSLMYIAIIIIQRKYISFRRCRLAKKILKAKKLDILKTFGLPQGIEYIIGDYW